jgi:hypothetical protein
MFCGIYHIDITFRMMKTTGSNGGKYLRCKEAWANFMRLVFLYFPHYVVYI